MRIISDKKILLSWLWVVLFAISIFLVVPVGNTIQRFVSGNWGGEAFIYFVLSALAIALICILHFLIFKLKIKSASNYVWLFIIAVLYTYFILKLRNAPAEAIHFLEYGLLSFFLFRALIYSIRDKSIFFIATLFALMVGTFDEIFQWITPQRYWDFRDVGLNALSGGLFQLALWKVINPRIICEKIRLKSIKILSSIFAVCILFIGLCASNTPKRVYWYTNLIPGISFLKEEEAMSEYGDKYKDPEIGFFYSRLSIENLLEIDEMKSEYFSQILNASFNKDYGKFLKKYSSFNYPFLYELRIHVYCRDTYFAKARDSSDLNEKKKLYFVAHKENLILDKYFSKTIKKSVYAWDVDNINEAGTLIDKNKSYKSPVIANLITFFSERTLWICIFVILILLLTINLFLLFKEKQKKLTNI